MIEFTIFRGYKKIEKILIKKDFVNFTIENIKYVLENEELSISIHFLDNYKKTLIYHIFNKDELIVFLELIKKKLNIKE